MYYIVGTLWDILNVESAQNIGNIKERKLKKNISVVLYPIFIHSPECIETTGLVNCPKTYFIVFYYKILANSQNLLDVFDSKFPQCA